jgi:long-subunit acyl-CoA synthetase (AMP-forming)
LGIKISLFKEALAFDKILERPKMNLETEITYGFTSGTTGIPKGVVFTHRMVIGQCLAMVGHYELKPTDVHMSFLPVAHLALKDLYHGCASSSESTFDMLSILYQSFLIDLATLKTYNYSIGSEDT